MRPANDRIRSWWTDDPLDPARPALTHPDVQSLLASLAPGEKAVELGGTMSLNLHLTPSDRVLREHQPFVAAARLHGEQALRRFVARSGMTAAEPLSFDGKTVLRCGKRLAEVEPFLDSEKPAASVASYRWLFSQMGTFHRCLLTCDIELPRSLAATWAPPGSLARWFQVTVPALSITMEGSLVAHRLGRLTNEIRRLWIPPSELPVQIVHGDFRLGNLVRSPSGQPIVFDFGFADRRPRIHDVAYSMAFMTLALEVNDISASIVADVVRHYEQSFGQALEPDERQTLPAYAAAVMLHAVAHDGFTAMPLAPLEHRLPFLDVADWFLANATEITGRIGED